MKIAVITGSTRPRRNNEAVARWAYELASKRSDAEFELVDIKDYNLPLLDEPVPASQGQYSQPHTKVWAAKIAAFDAYVFVTPEYNHGTSAALKNAIDYLYPRVEQQSGRVRELWGRRWRTRCRASQRHSGEREDCDGACAGDAVTVYGLRKLHDVSARPSPRAGSAYDAQSGHRLGRSTAIAPNATSGCTNRACEATEA